jgi:hypothetical protein
MQRANDDKRCYETECRYFDRPHYHVLTPNGSYVRYIIEKVNKEQDNAYTR